MNLGVSAMDELANLPVQDRSQPEGRDNSGPPLALGAFNGE